MKSKKTFVISIKKTHLLIAALVLVILIGASIYLIKNPDLLIKKDKVAINYAAAASEISQNCPSDRDWKRCFGDQLEIYNRTHTLKDTMAVLDTLEKTEPKTRDCHLLAHKIASSEIEKDPGKWLDLFKVVDQDLCNGGFIHGAIEGRKRFDNTLELNAETIPKICDMINRATGKKNNDPCAHVIGHVLLAEVYGDLEAGTAICNDLSGKLSSSCNNGLFMENITRDNLVEHAVAEHIAQNEEDAKEIEEICESYTGVARTSCWREISHLYTNLAKNDPKKSYELCSRSPSEANRDECYIHSFNSFMAGSNFTDEQIQFVCTPFINTPKLNRCFNWATHMMVGASLKLTEKAINFCSRVGNNLEDLCFKELGKNLAKLTDQKNQQNLCLGSPEIYRQSCNCPDCERKEIQKAEPIED